MDALCYLKWSYPHNFFGMYTSDGTEYALLVASSPNLNSEPTIDHTMLQQTYLKKCINILFNKDHFSIESTRMPSWYYHHAIENFWI